MVTYKPTWHLLERQKQDPGGHRYSAGHAALIHYDANFVGIDPATGCQLYHGLIDGRSVLD